MYKVKWVFTGISHDCPDQKAVELYINNKVHGNAVFTWTKTNGQASHGGMKIADIFKCLEK